MTETLVYQIERCLQGAGWTWQLSANVRTDGDGLTRPVSSAQWGLTLTHWGARRQVRRAARKWNRPKKALDRGFISSTGEFHAGR